MGYRPEIPGADGWKTPETLHTLCALPPGTDPAEAVRTLRKTLRQLQRLIDRWYQEELRWGKDNPAPHETETRRGRAAYKAWFEALTQVRRDAWSAVLGRPPTETETLLLDADLVFPRMMRIAVRTLPLLAPTFSPKG